MRIALYQPYPHGLDGLQKIVTHLATHLGGPEFTSLIILPEHGVYADELTQKGITFRICDPGCSWKVYGRGAGGLSYIFSARRFIDLIKYWFQLSRVLRAEGVSILHCNDYRAVLLAAPAARLAGIPCLWHMHGYIQNKWATILTASLVHWTVPVSRGMLDYLKFPLWMLGRYQVIHNGIESTATEVNWSKRTKPVVLAVGNQHPRKGYDTLLRAFRRVVEEFPGAECWIVGGPWGDGAHARELADLAQELQVTASVKFLGLSDRVNEIMEEALMLVSSSRIEAFGLVATEAMNMALPVIGTDTGGLKDIVVHGETGYLVPIDDEAALCDRLVELLRHPERAREFGEAGQRRLRENFTLERMVQNFADFYRMLLRADGRRAVAANSPRQGGSLPHA